MGLTFLTLRKLGMDGGFSVDGLTLRAAIDMVCKSKARTTCTSNPWKDSRDG